MYKVLCKNDRYSLSEILVFKKGQVYLYNEDEDAVWCERLNKYYYIISLFERYFYTPEETVTMIRKNKIDKVLNG